MAFKNCFSFLAIDGVIFVIVNNIIPEIVSSYSRRY